MTPGRVTGHKTLIPAEGEISSSAMFQFSMCTVESGWMNKRKLMDNTAEEFQEDFLGEKVPER